MGKKILLILLIILLLIIPFVFDWITFTEAGSKIFREEPSKWTEFWGTFISGIATVIMLAITWKTFIAENSPIIIVDLVQLNKDDFDIHVLNYGKSVAYGITISVNIPEGLREMFGNKKVITVDVGNIAPTHRKRVKFLRRANSDDGRLSDVLTERIQQSDFERYIKHHHQSEIRIKCTYNKNKKVVEETSLNQAIWNKVNFDSDKD